MTLDALSCRGLAVVDNGNRHVLIADARNGLRKLTVKTVSTPSDNAALLLIDVQDCFLDKYTTSDKV